MDSLDKVSFIRSSDGLCSSALSDLVRWIALFSAPHDYIATIRLLDRYRGVRLRLQARRRSAAGDEYVQEISLGSLEVVGAAAAASGFDRAARAALTSMEIAEEALDRAEQG